MRKGLLWMHSTTALRRAASSLRAMLRSWVFNSTTPSSSASSEKLSFFSSSSTSSARNVPTKIWAVSSSPSSAASFGDVCSPSPCGLSGSFSSALLSASSVPSPSFSPVSAACSSFGGSSSPSPGSSASLSLPSPCSSVSSSSTLILNFKRATSASSSTSLPELPSSDPFLDDTAVLVASDVLLPGRRNSSWRGAKKGMARRKAMRSAPAKCGMTCGSISGKQRTARAKAAKARCVASGSSAQRHTRSRQSAARLKSGDLATLPTLERRFDLWLFPDSKRDLARSSSSWLGESSPGVDDITPPRRRPIKLAGEDPISMLGDLRRMRDCREPLSDSTGESDIMALPASLPPTDSLR
mmetsp:Transcript_30646/g.65211  ORF Transcript_30646/g.65211 Transcript_30646/m.65211 type:complete len:355 (-) Transcript_30646:1497-2561(-)